MNTTLPSFAQTCPACGQPNGCAIAAGGVITFDCGPDPVTITLTQTAKIFNDAGPDIVIDGAGKITLSGTGAELLARPEIRAAYLEGGRH